MSILSFLLKLKCNKNYFYLVKRILEIYIRLINCNLHFTELMSFIKVQ